MIRQRHPDVGVLVLSQYVDVDYALRLMGAGAAGVGYLLKDRIVDVDQFVADLHRVAQGETVVDPTLVSDLVAGPIAGGRIARLTSREREVLAMVAAGHNNAAIAAQLALAPKTVRNHISNIMTKLHVSHRAQAIIRARAAGLK